MSTTTSRSRRLWRTTFIVLAVGIVVFGIWYIRFLTREGRFRYPDKAAATLANTRGIGHMDQFEYAKAVTEFENAANLDFDSKTATINWAIALLNTQTPDNLARAATLLDSVLAQEPNNPHAHYTLGIINLYTNKLPEAATHFEAVTRIDPKDAHAWYHRGLTHSQKDESPEAKEFFRKALSLNPNLNAARYALALHSHERDEAKTRALLEEHKALAASYPEHEYGLKYTEMGRYAEVIGRTTAMPQLGPLPLFDPLPGFAIQLAVNTRWATPADDDELRKVVRVRFGGTLVRLDYDKDGKPDLLLLAAVVREGKLADLLLHNDGNGKFTDTTTAVGLGRSANLGFSVGDFDNDGFPDLFFTGPSGMRLFRNSEGKGFTDVTAAARLDKKFGMPLGALWIDLDQDGDVDLLVAVARSSESAIATLNGKPQSDWRISVYLNVGEAKPVPPGVPPPPLTVQFRPEEFPAFQAIRGPVTGFVATDIDGDKDVDVVVLVDGEAPIVIVNDRLLRFHRGPAVTPTAGSWSGGLVLDANGDEQSDLFLLPANGKPIFRTSTDDAQSADISTRFTDGATDSPPLIQAQTIDLDLDGRADIVGLTRDGKAVLLRGDGKGKLSQSPGAFGPNVDRLQTLFAIAIDDMDSDGLPDVIAWPTGAGPSILRNLGGKNRGLTVDLSGRRDKGSNLRTNADGVGAVAMAYAGPVRSRIENTTLNSGLGQSRRPFTLGLGPADAAEILRLRWPDGVPQAELNLAAGPAKIVESNRKGTSCPVLFTWDGTRFRYVTDFLGGGAMGELGPDGTARPPRPEESVKIEPGQLILKNGRYVLKIAEPMDEVTYLDQLTLDIIDHPIDAEVYPDERFATGGPEPTQELLAFRTRLTPVRATDHRGRDVTATIRTRDGLAVNNFAVRSWLGFAEEHCVELDFGNFTTNSKSYLVLAGWTDYPYPESIFAANQANVPMVTPVLEQQMNDGAWVNVLDLGMPAGLPKVMTRLLPAGLTGKLRIRTNLQIFWDQIVLATAEKPETVTSLPVTSASLAHRGFVREVVPRSGTPIEYDDDRLEPVAVSKWVGHLTKLGDVTPLLTARDDRFVLCGPGDEITAAFDATTLPPLTTGHVRSFVLRTKGYCKDTSSFTQTGGQITPLPYRDMKNYPPVVTTPPPTQAVYDREWNTRPFTSSRR